ERLFNHCAGLDYLYVILVNIGPLFWAMIALGLILLVHRRGTFDVRTALAACLIYVAFQTGLFCARSYQPRDGEDLQFVRHFLDERRLADNGLATVYCPSVGRVEYVWVELGAKAYFDTFQLSGVIFQRPTAIEGERRARLVAPF